MVLEVDSLELLTKSLAKLESSFSDMPDFKTEVNTEAMAEVLMSVAEKMQDNLISLNGHQKSKWLLKYLP
ncbi:MAG: hypothetical protein GY808_06605 [Gammaproteobacteria bacterium]|nr:hypothetical protein [Gammaproteobacteria bacterium]